MQKLPRSSPEAAGGLPAIVRPGHSSSLPDWRHSLPAFGGTLVGVREVRTEDAGALLETAGDAEVAKFMSTPPATVEAFERFIAWAHRERRAGNVACFAVVPHGSEKPVGLFQLRVLDLACETAEWGFAIGSRFWNSGFYADGAPLIVDFAFNALGVRRLVARSAVANGRGNGALRKMGATREGVLRGSLLKDGEYLDQAIWTISAPEWRVSRHSKIVRLH